MPVLKNAKHELFAQELAKGTIEVTAYAKAGYKPDDGNASKLASKPEIQARVQEITGKAAAKVGVTVERIMAELAMLGFSNMQDYIRIGSNGLPYTDFSKLTREQAAAIGEVHVESVPVVVRDGEEIKPEVTKVRFKLSDKRAALVDLGKQIGMFKERIEHTGKDGGAIAVEVNEIEAGRRIAFALAKAQRSKPADKPQE